MSIIQASPRSFAAQLAVSIYGDVLDAVRADRLVDQFVTLDGDILTIQGEAYDLRHFDRIFVAGAGKASVETAKAVENILGDRIDGGLIVTKKGHAAPLKRIEVLEAAHPIPDESSLAAGEEMIRLSEKVKEGDLVLFLLSGGASALMEHPVGELSLSDLQATNRVLLASGADIAQVNTVRSYISRLKAGGLARAFRKATIVALVLSDVVGNSLAAIGSGPLFGGRGDAHLPDSLIEQLPEAVRREVLAGDLLGRATPAVPHHVIGSVSVAIHAAIEACEKRGIEPLAYGDPMVGEAREMSRKIMDLAKRQIQARAGLPFCMIFGGETTVALRGSGKGGRCQEMALAAASAISKLSGTAFLAAGTDGNDGPTHAAGGLVESDSTLIAKAADVEARKALVANDSYRFLDACGGLIVTGPTGSNVNDICLVVNAKQ